MLGKASGDLSSLCQAWCGASETLVKLFATNACNSILAVEKRVVAMASSVEDFDAAMAEIVEMLVTALCKRYP